MCCLCIRPVHDPAEAFGHQPAFAHARLSPPLGMIITGGAVLLTGGALGAAALTRACDPIFRRTIHEASFNALFLPVPAEQRRRARTLLEGLYAIAFGLAGAVFLLVQHAAPARTYQYWSLPVLLLSLWCIALLVWARREYVRAVVQSVTHRRLDFEGQTLDIADETTVALLVRTLHGVDERQVVHVLHLIAGAPGAVWLPHVAMLVTHPSPQVRVMALRYLGRAADPAYANDIDALLEAPEDEVRSAAIDALCATAGPDAAERVAPLLDDPGALTRGAAVTALLLEGGEGYAPRAAAHLEGMLVSNAPEMRRGAAQVLGALAGRIPDTASLFLHDESGGASGRSKDGEGAAPLGTSVAHLVRLLEDKLTRPAAGDNLVRHGSHALPALSALLGDPTRDRAMRVQTPRIVQRIGGPPPVQVLIDHLAEADDLVRAGIFRALAHLRTSGNDIPVDEAALHLLIMAEVCECYKLSVWHADLQAGAEDALVCEALLARVERALDRIFSLLELRYPGHGLTRTRQTLRTDDSGARAMAAELLDSLLEHRLAELVLPLVEATPERVVEIAGSRLGVPRRSARERLAELAGSDDPWLRTCAIARIGTLGDTRLAPLAAAALDSDDPLVCEAALGACTRLLEPAQLHTVLIEQASASGFPGVRRYAHALLRDMEEA
ncbi:MAG: HEAT repeat domain-containing protein [Chloroflexota bacterium]